MKAFKFILLAVFFISGLTVISCSQKSETEKPDISWEDAKEAYHDVMSSTFHPAENDDLAPLKERSEELETRSKDWKMIEIPENLNADELKPLLEQLFSDSKAMHKMVKKEEADEDLKKAIYALHDVYHNVVGACDHEH